MRGQWLAVNTLAIVAALVLAAAPVRASAGKGSFSEEWARTCVALQAADFSRVADAPSQVTAAKPIDAAGITPAYCQVQGYVSPNVGFELRLPMTHWNGKFLKLGCGGACGTIFAESCNTPLRKGYACIASDMGHRSTASDGKWAYNNLQAEVDFGFRATHVVTLAGKAITENFYSKAPSRSYYMGCSTGGRQGLVSAQRFPWDFDGIVVGAPAIQFTDLMMKGLWSSRAITGQTGQRILGPDDLKVVHEAVLARCDMDDGVKDGVIGDPRRCAFDPAFLTCKAGKKAGCLSQQQVDAFQKLYAGPTDSTGRPLSSGGPMLGTELAFGRYYSGWTTLKITLSDEVFSYMAFDPDPGPGWRAGDFDFDRDPKRFGVMEALYDASNPDLRRFKAANGKLLMYHGWNDAGPSPLGTVDYYESVERTMGGREATQNFLRLFMVPGMDHCTGGDGAFAIDYLSYLENWVEKGNAPEVIIGAHVEDSYLDTIASRSSMADVAAELKRLSAASSLPLPLDTSVPVSFTRPIYPYPLRAQYKGTGDPKDARNFRPIER